MNKKKIKCMPDGGTLPTYTTGTPEYEAYLAKKKQYDAFVEKEKAYSTYGNYTVADKATFGSIQPMMVSPNTSATGYRIYNTKESPSVVNTDEHYDPTTGRYYVPYYDSPGDATVVKSQAEIDQEKKLAEEAEWKKQYQGYIVNSNESVQNEDGTWSKVQEATPYPINQPLPTDGTFHTDLPAGAIVKMAGGGKLGSYIGDGLKLYGDYGLSMIGLNNVINDDMYKNKGFADASRVAEKFGSYAGQIAGNIIAPGIGGQVVKQGQNVLGNIQSEDTYRQHLDEINSLGEQGQLGKFQNGAYSTSDFVQPAMGITTGIGELGNAITGQGIDGMKNQVSNLKDTVSNLPIFPFGGDMNNYEKRQQSGFTLRPNKYGEQNYFDYVTQGQIDIGSNIGDISAQSEKIGLFDSIGQSMRVNKNTRESGRDVARVKLNAFVDRDVEGIPQLGCGGSVKKMADGGEFIEYNGPDHANGGIPIDQNGQPTVPQIAQAEVEGGETMHDDGIDKYIFSDRLMQDPKSKVTFADVSKKINRKYKDVNDKFQKEARELELNRLKQEQEIFKSTIANTQNNQQQTPMFPDGGPLQFGPVAGIDPEQYFASLQEPLVYAPEANNYYGPVDQTMSRLPNNTISSIPFNLPDYSKYKDNSSLSPIYFDSKDGIKAPNEDYTLQEEAYVKGTTPEEMKKAQEAAANGLPQDKINPLGFAASNMGNIYDLFQAARPLEKNKFDKVSLDGISLESQRRELEKQAGLARDTNRESVRNLATSSGQALGNQIVGNALINSSLGSGLSQSFLSEATTNTGIKNQEEMTNNQIRQNEIIADQMDKAKRQSTTSQALHSVGMNTQGYVRDLKSADVGNENNKMWFDAINNSSKYFIIGYDANNNPVYQPKDGSGKVITKPKNA